MTVEQFIDDLWHTLDKDTQLKPYDTDDNFDLTTTGGARMLRWLNRGLAVMGNLKRRDGRTIEFPQQLRSLFFKTALVSGTCASGSSSTATLDASAGANEDQYNGWLIKITGGTGSGQIRLIVDYTAARVATVHSAWTTTPDATSTYTLYKRFMKFLNAGETGASENITRPVDNGIIHPLKITHIEDKVDLAYGGRVASYPSDILSTDTPSMWFLYGEDILFDTAPDEEIYYRLEYRSFLDEYTSGQASSEIDIPKQFQELLFLWGVWKGRQWLGEPNAAYGAKRDFYDFMESLRLMDDGMFDREDGGVVVMGL